MESVNFVILGDQEIATDFGKKGTSTDLKSLKQGTRWSLYLLLFGIWDLMIGFAYLLFSYFEITQVTMIIANALFITGSYLTFLSFSIANKLQTLKRN